jgi:hypothetical protein
MLACPKERQNYSKDIYRTNFFIIVLIPVGVNQPITKNIKKRMDISVVFEERHHTIISDQKFLSD